MKELSSLAAHCTSDKLTILGCPAGLGGSLNPPWAQVRTLLGAILPDSQVPNVLEGLAFHILAESLDTQAAMLQDSLSLWSHGSSSSQVQGAQTTMPLSSVPTGTRSLQHLICMWALWTSGSQAITPNGLRWIRWSYTPHMKCTILLEATSLWCSWKLALCFLTLCFPSVLHPQMWLFQTFLAGLQDGGPSPNKVRKQSAGSIPLLEFEEGMMALWHYRREHVLSIKGLQVSEDWNPYPSIAICFSVNVEFCFTPGWLYCLQRSSYIYFECGMDI